MRFQGRPSHQRGRSAMLWPFRGGAGGSSPLIAMIALMFLGQLVVISYMRAHNSCNPLGGGQAGQPLSLVRSDAEQPGDGYFGGVDDDVTIADDDREGLMAGLDDDDYEPIVADGAWGAQAEEAGWGTDGESMPGYEQDLLPRIKAPMIVGTYFTLDGCVDRHGVYACTQKP